MIKSLYLHNFKCFENQSIEFSNLTLLSGVNGMGKTSVLQALLLLRQSYQQKLLLETGFALNGDLVEIGTAEDALYEDTEKPELAFTMALENGTEGKWHCECDNEKDILRYASVPVVNSDIFQQSLFTDNFHYLQAERIGPRIAFEKSDFLVMGHKQLGTRGEYTTHFLSIFGSDDICCEKLALPVASSVENPLRLIIQTEAWLGKIRAGTHLHFNDIPGTAWIQLKYSFSKEQNVPTSQYRPTDVGFGITYVLPVIVALLSSTPNHIVLLENPEAHLHPGGQTCMGQLIARAASMGAQVIAETHSDHVLNGIRIAVRNGLLKPEQTRFHYFDDENDRVKVVTPKIDDNGRIPEWPEGFFDEWDRSLFELL